MPFITMDTVTQNTAEATRIASSLGDVDHSVSFFINKALTIVYLLFPFCPNNRLVFKPVRKTVFIHFTCRQRQYSVNGFGFRRH